VQLGCVLLYPPTLTARERKKLCPIINRKQQPTSGVNKNKKITINQSTTNALLLTNPQATTQQHGNTLDLSPECVLHIADLSHPRAKTPTHSV
jgi:hypothetical protein